MCEEERLDDNAEGGTQVKLYLIILYDLTLYFIIYLKGIKSPAKLIDHREPGEHPIAVEYVCTYMHQAEN